MKVPFSHRITVEPASEPVTAAEVKSNRRISYTDEDSYIGDLITRARKHVEQILDRQLISATYELKLDAFLPCIYVPKPPLIAVSSIAYIDTNGDSQTLAATKYRVSATSTPGRITEAYQQSWPTTREVTDAVTITHTAGYGTDASDVPADIRSAIIVLASHWHLCREGEHAIPDTVYHLLDPYMLFQFA